MTQPARLPAADQAEISQQRVIDYLLNPEHAEGTSKARFFLKRGFSTSEWQAFASALRVHGQTNTVTKISKDKWGTRFRVDCTLVTPDGLNPCIRTVWLLEADASHPRLITAHPFRSRTSAE